MAPRAARNAPSRPALVLRASLAFGVLSALGAPLVRVAPAGAAACCAPGLAELDDLASGGSLPAEYRPGVLLLRDDGEGALYSTLVELSRRQGGRALVRRLIDSGFITVLASERLRPLQAGLWGPIFSQGEVVGAALRIDIGQIHGLDHDPTGVETLAHELRHQVDAARAFRKVGSYEAVYRAAVSGDITRSAQQYARRIRRQRPDISAAEAQRWLRPLVTRLPAIRGELFASSSAEPGSSPDSTVSTQRER